MAVLPVPELTASTLARLRQRLGAEALTEGLIDVAYRSIDSPVGPLLLAATPRGLVRLAFEVEDHDLVLEQLAELSPRVLHAPARLDGPAKQLDEYFSGRRTRFELDLDLARVGGFRRSVLDQLLTIDFGRTASYRSIAAAAGSPAAVRAAGSACARNPLPVVVPCHRVVRSDGTIGQYLGGTEAKRTLLAFERQVAGL
ncbi:MAG: methylated-DNA--[protein]-cysteine S-methyltransferase [Acidimicrobiales bacterium]